MQVFRYMYIDLHALLSVPKISCVVAEEFNPGKTLLRIVRVGGFTFGAIQSLCDKLVYCCIYE